MKRIHNDLKGIGVILLAGAALSATAIAFVPQNEPADPSRMSPPIQNVPPEEAAKRILLSVLPKYPELAREAHITGAVDIALAISPEGDVSRGSRVLLGPPLLAAAAMAALRQWKFRPNVVDGQPTFSRVRALVRFNADGSSEVAFARAILPDSFGDPGTPRNRILEASQPAVVRGNPSPIKTLCDEIGRGETGSGSFRNEYLGLTFQFPPDWRVADAAALATIEASQAGAAPSQYETSAPNVTMIAIPSCFLFSASLRTGTHSLTRLSIWAEREFFMRTAEQYFKNKPYLHDRTAEGTRGPESAEINGTEFSRGDRWATVDGSTVYQARLVTPIRDLMLGIDVIAESKAAVDKAIERLSRIHIAQAANKSTSSH